MSLTGLARRDGRIDRGESTRLALMRAAENLIAERGIENVAVKDIVREAGQNNASALQYHFGSLQGLVEAIRAARGGEIKAKRAALTGELMARDAVPDLRDICCLMIAPAFELARTDPGFRKAIRAFGHEIALAEGQAGAAALKSDSSGSLKIAALLRSRLSDLDDGIFLLRLDGALRYLAASMVHQARRADAFRGPQADMFFNNLADTLAGLLSAPVSEKTRESVRERRKMKRRSG
jgi:AcrR family transcriptional regulator